MSSLVVCVVTRSQRLEYRGPTKRKLNHDLTMRGLLIVMADERTKLARETSEFLRDTYDANMFQTRIRQCVKVA